MVSDAPIPFDELFDASFLAAVARLRVVAKRVPRGGRFAEQRSKAKGSGLEFQDYRAYSPGDEFRAIDWNLYQRLGKVFLRLFEELEDLPFYLMPDVSSSLWFPEDGRRARAVAGLRTTLALAAVGANQHDSVGVFPFAGDVLPSLPPKTGKGRIFQVARYLAEQRPSGTTDFQRAMRRFAGEGRRSGLVCVVSDFFDPNGADAVIAALGSLRHRLLLVQLARESDRSPALAGDLRLVDSEGGEHADVSVTPALLERYSGAYDAFQAQLTGFARQRGAGFLRLDADGDLLAQIATLFEGGRYVA